MDKHMASSYTADKKQAKKKRKSHKHVAPIKIDLSNCKYELLRIIAGKLGWIQVNGDADSCCHSMAPCDDFDIYWTDTSVSMERVLRLNHTQKINHFYGMLELCRKKAMAKHLAAMAMLQPQQYNFFPLTFTLPDDYAALLADAKSRGKKQIYIIKPDAGCQGKGIRLVQGGNESNMSKALADISMANVVVQHYLKNPVLINGFKFDLRVYALVLSADPLRVFLYNEGLVRFCTEPYSRPCAGNLDCAYMHLTNYAVNKKNTERFVAALAPGGNLVGLQGGFHDTGGASSPDMSEGDVASKWCFRQLQQYLQQQGHDWAPIWSNIAAVVVKSLLAVVPVLRANYRAAFPTATGTATPIPPNSSSSSSSSSSHTLQGPGGVASVIGGKSASTLAAASSSSRCFEVLGYDILLDAKLRPWLVEVNHSPSFNIDSPLDRSVKEQLICDALQLVRVDAKQIHAAKKAAKRAAQERLLAPATKRERPSSAEWAARAARQAQALVESRAATMTARQKYEDKHKGGFERIYPAENDVIQEEYVSMLKAAECIYQQQLQRQQPPPQPSFAAITGNKSAFLINNSAAAAGGMTNATFIATARQRSHSTSPATALGSTTGSSSTHCSRPQQLAVRCSPQPAAAPAAAAAPANSKWPKSHATADEQLMAQERPHSVTGLRPASASGGLASGGLASSGPVAASSANGQPTSSHGSSCSSSAESPCSAGGHRRPHSASKQPVSAMTRPLSTVRRPQSATAVRPVGANTDIAPAAAHSGSSSNATMYIYHAVAKARPASAPRSTARSAMPGATAISHLVVSKRLCKQSSGSNLLGLAGLQNSAGDVVSDDTLSDSSLPLSDIDNARCMGNAAHGGTKTSGSTEGASHACQSMQSPASGSKKVGCEVSEALQTLAAALAAAQHDLDSTSATTSRPSSRSCSRSSSSRESNRPVMQNHAACSMISAAGSSRRVKTDTRPSHSLQNPDKSQATTLHQHHKSRSKTEGSSSILGILTSSTSLHDEGSPDTTANISKQDNNSTANSGTGGTSNSSRSSSSCSSSPQQGHDSRRQTQNATQPARNATTCGHARLAHNRSISGGGNHSFPAGFAAASRRKYGSSKSGSGYIKHRTVSEPGLGGCSLPAIADCTLLNAQYLAAADASEAAVAGAHAGSGGSSKPSSAYDGMFGCYNNIGDAAFGNSANKVNPFLVNQDRTSLTLRGRSMPNKRLLRFPSFQPSVWSTSEPGVGAAGSCSILQQPSVHAAPSSSAK
eukprot:jgi/Chrzof1/9185/Cz03g39030.t1